MSRAVRVVVAIACACACAAAGVACDGALHRMQDREERRPDVAPPAGAVAWVGSPARQTGGLVAEAGSPYQRGWGEPPPGQQLAGSGDGVRGVLARGQDRFDRTCAACHGVLGDGDSDVARAMLSRRPPSLIEGAAARLSDARIATAIESGYGAMPALADVLPPADRDAVIAFVRVLQRREVALDDLSPAERADALRALAARAPAQAGTDPLATPSAGGAP